MTGTESLFQAVRRYRLARRTFPKSYGRRLCWRWAKDAS